MCAGSFHYQKVFPVETIEVKTTKTTKPSGMRFGLPTGRLSCQCV